MKRLPLSYATLFITASLISSGLHAQTWLFHDDFSNVTSGSTPLNGRAASTGTWTAPVGAPVVTGTLGGGYVETQGARRVMDANFSRPLQSGEYLTIEWMTKESDGVMGNGHAGITLFNGATQFGFLGSTSADSNHWILADHATAGTLSASTNVLLTNANESARARLVYSYDTGIAELRVVGGSGQTQIGNATLNLTPNQAVNLLQIENNGGGDERFTKLSASARTTLPFRWNADSNGTWGTASHWNSGAVADGIDHVAIFSDVNYTGNRTITVDGTKTIGELIVGDFNPSSAGVVTLSGGTLSLQSSLGKPIIQADNAATNITSQLSGNQGFVKTGVGTVSLNNTANANTLSGNVIVEQGILGISNDLALGALPSSFQADALVLNGGVLANMTNTTQGGTTQFSNGHSVTIHANRGVTLGGNNGTFRVGYHTGQYMAVNSVISGVGGLNKDDNANLILRGANTYQGDTQLNGGSIYAHNTSGSATGTGSVFVKNGTTLGGTGIIGGGAGKTIDLQGGSTLKIGNSHAGAINGSGFSVDTAPQTLTIGQPGAGTNLNVNLNGLMQFDLFGIESDHLDINTTGTVNMNNATLALGMINTNGWQVGQEWKLIDWDGATLTNTTGLDQFSMWHQSYELEGEVRADGYYLSIVPEPSRALLMMLAPIVLGLNRRRTA